MNHRYEDRSYERGDRDRERERGQQFGRDDRWRESGRDFYPGNYGSEDRNREQPGQQQYSGSGSGGSSYGASGYGSYGGQGQFGRERDYGQSQHRPGRYGESEQYGRGGEYGGSYQGGGSSNWRQQREGGSYGGYGTTGDYGYGSQGQGSQWQGGWGRRQFGSADEEPQYYGTGNYSSGGSGYGGGFGGMQGGIGPYGPSGSYYGSTQRSGGEFAGGRSIGERSERPGLLSRVFGRGPKGYKRSDERLREDISERLMHSDTIDSSDVTVEVTEGRVSLQGTVPERYMKHAIEDVVDSCHGVQDIDNRIRVERGERSGSSSFSGTGSTATGPSGSSSTMSGGATTGGNGGSTGSSAKTTRKE
jgi:hypothetical protein